MASRVANITDVGIRRRYRHGVVFAIVAIAAAVILIATGSPRWTRLLVFFPLALAANGFLQAREKTCVVLGVMGTRETGEGGYARMSQAECAVAQRQVVSIVIKDVIIAAAVTALVWVI